jgi:hypothetical protein
MLLVGNACRMLVVTFIGCVLVLGGCDGDFMVVIDKDSSEWSLRTVV